MQLRLNNLTNMNEINPNVDVNPLADEIKNLEAQIANIDVTKLDPLDNGKLKQTSPVVEPTQQPIAEVKPKADNSIVNITSESIADPILAELERVKGQTQGKTPKEKFEYKLQREIAQAKSMGVDVAKLVGIKQAEPEEEDEDKPLTKKDLESYLSKVQQTSPKTAMEMALEIQNEAERELYTLYLDEVNPNLSEEQKFKAVSERVEGIKLKNQIGLQNLKPSTQTYSTATSFQPAKPNQQLDNATLTREEQLFYDHARITGVPLTKEEIIKMRK